MPVYPASGAVAMLPLTPANDWTPTNHFCGGSGMTKSIGAITHTPTTTLGPILPPQTVGALLPNLKIAHHPSMCKMMICSMVVLWISSSAYQTVLCWWSMEAAMVLLDTVTLRRLARHPVSTSCLTVNFWLLVLLQSTTLTCQAAVAGRILVLGHPASPDCTILL